MNISCKNHEHPFVLFYYEKEVWMCDGDTLFGQCKLGLKRTDNYYGFERFKCTVCPDFDLCRNCLEAPKRKIYKCKNHNHGFVKVTSNGEWTCDGSKKFGQCKSMNTQFNQIYKKNYFKCVECENFNLCTPCFEAPKILLYKSAHHEHDFEMRISKDWYWRCDGDQLFGRCEAGMDKIYSTNDGKERYTCISCEDFDLCQACMEKV